MPWQNQSTIDARNVQKGAIRTTGSRTPYVRAPAIDTEEVDVSVTPNITTSKMLLQRMDERFTGHKNLIESPRHKMRGEARLKLFRNERHDILHNTAGMEGRLEVRI